MSIQCPSHATALFATFIHLLLYIVRVGRHLLCVYVIWMSCFIIIAIVIHTYAFGEAFLASLKSRL